jgi:hypothetical protein
MHRAQEGWLVQSFCFADDFCAYAAAEERPAPQQPKTSLARRVKRLLLYGALLLLSLSGAARAQEPPQLSAYMGVTRLSEEFYLHRWYAICNTDPYAYIDVIQISEFGAPVEVTQAPPGWTCSQSSEYDFDCAAEWNPVAPGMCLGGFVIWSGEYNWAPVKLLLGGRYNDLDDPGAVLLDYTWGPGGGS